ncbi:hypothetical protein ASE60_27060 [Ensifer sp. Root278]|nr:hypothetical protein ASE60_27060 [Ensifer sp. Root278]
METIRAPAFLAISIFENRITLAPQKGEHEKHALSRQAEDRNHLQGWTFTIPEDAVLQPLHQPGGAAMGSARRATRKASFNARFN